MPRKIYAIRGGKLKDVTREYTSIKDSPAPAVFSDIEPYRFMGSVPGQEEAKPLVSSRSKEREFLKAGGYEQVGNELPNNPNLRRFIENERERGR